MQVAAFVPLTVRLGQGLEENVPDPSDENMTVPVGFVAVVEDVSVTVAVHEAAAPTKTGESHETVVEVGSVTFWVTVAP